MPRLYLDESYSEIAHVVSYLDRNSASATYGCFDRRYWSWRIGDMANASLQYGMYPLAWLWKHDDTGTYKGAGNILEWIQAAIRFTAKIQKGNGSFNQFFLNEQSVGTTYYLLSAMLNVHDMLREALAHDVHDALESTIARAGGFVMKHDENYAIISNHIALFAYVNLKLGALLKDVRYEQKAHEQLELIFRHQSAEGWFLEYDGADPGYQTQCTYYLAECHRLTGDERMLKIIQRSVENFLIYFFHPDGSFGGVYGSRNTEIIYPAGFEMLRNRLPRGNEICEFIHEGLRNKTLATPKSLDDENLIRLSTNYLVASQYADRTLESPGDDAGLPWTCAIEKDFPEAGFVIRGNEHYYFIMNYKKGGVYRAFDKKRKIMADEDSGYFLSARQGVLTNQMFENKVPVVAGPRVSFVSHFYKTLDSLPTPIVTIILRMFSLTLFRFVSIVDLFRMVLVKFAFTGKKQYDILLRRAVSFENTRITIEDELTTGRNIRIKKQLAGRKAFSVKMASSNYHVPGDLVEIRHPVVDTQLLNDAHCLSIKREIKFS